jgi:hypothetical protein
MFLQCCKSKQEHCFSTSSQQTEIADADNLNYDEINLLKNGDIIMRQGRGALSLSISSKLNETYKLSHSEY